MILVLWSHPGRPALWVFCGYFDGDYVGLPRHTLRPPLRDGSVASPERLGHSHSRGRPQPIIEKMEMWPYLSLLSGQGRWGGSIEDLVPEHQEQHVPQEAKLSLTGFTSTSAGVEWNAFS